MITVVAGGIAFLAAALVFCATVAASDTPHAQTLPVAPHRPAAPVHPASTATCATPAPTTAAGYAAMFRALPVAQWGAADVSISVKVGARVVWLYGDTISGTATQWTRFVHSTAITQDQGCLHVSHAGAQLLPNDDADHWYWIKAAAAVDSSHLRITADRVERTGSGIWDFAVVGEATATAVLASNGDVTFQAWSGARVAPQHIVQKDGGSLAPWTQTVSEIATGKVLVSGLPHSTSNWSYAPSLHPEVRLASGRTLLTVCQNGSPLSYDVYRPMFFEVTL